MNLSGVQLDGGRDCRALAVWLLRLGCFLPLQINNLKWDINSQHSTDLNKANGLTTLQQVNESSAQYVFLAQRTVIMRVLWSLAGLKGNSADFTLN